MLARLIQLFPFWAVLCAVWAIWQPQVFSGFKGLIVPLLAIVMLSMGLTLTLPDFRRVITLPKVVLTGVLLQFIVMPLSALMLAKAFAFNSEQTLGMVLVGCVAGGTASNVLCYLAKGDVALSITMTAVSTLLGVVVTPLLIDLLVGHNVNIDISAMVWNLCKIVLIPVLTGVLINHFCVKQVNKIASFLPLISMLTIVFIIAIVVALNATTLAGIGSMLALAVVLHNAIGLGFGYGAGKWLGFDERLCRTLAFEVGMQNSGLAVALAMKFFTPASALAGTLFSVWHNVSGSILASMWQRQSKVAADKS
ncbi:bile acid:sodium symporter family protein [Pseudoalteromonas fenneropenaei]|uniref:Bile acid:sodium symporter family protein n=1 Tax=Pseudoalteromonas fenneropenaei TaxID=1737459 RepID=A0ABV7CFY5_9GAMM